MGAFIFLAVDNLSLILNFTIPLSRNPMESAEMLLAIRDSPIVSSGTLRSDHLCAALLSEADRLGIELDRKLWQPAAAIVAHGLRGICLDLPPRLREIQYEIVSDLLDELNWHAPSGCSLGTSEGDGALLLWELTIDAKCEAINADTTEWEAVTLEIPAHWLSAVINGDESSFDYYDDAKDYQAYKAFCEHELSNGWTIADQEDESYFSNCHDATNYWVLPCSVVKCLAMRKKPAS